MVLFFAFTFMKFFKIFFLDDFLPGIFFSSPNFFIFIIQTQDIFATKFNNVKQFAFHQPQGYLLICRFCSRIIKFLCVSKLLNGHNKRNGSSQYDIVHSSLLQHRHLVAQILTASSFVSHRDFILEILF